jgi:hypothetical protein
MFGEGALDERAPAVRLATPNGAVEELQLLLVQSKYDGVIGHIATSSLEFGQPPERKLVAGVG